MSRARLAIACAPLAALLAAAPLALLLAAAPLALVLACASDPAEPPPIEAAHYESPQAAVDAIGTACRSHQPDALVALVGSAHKQLVVTGNPAHDAERCQRYLKAAAEMTRLDPWGDQTLIVVVGSDEHALPVPLVKDELGWRFDGAAGEREVLQRTVGRNELHAIEFALAYYGAQQVYAATGHDGAAGGAYATRIVSTPAKHDGLYWPDGEASAGRSPLGPFVAAAEPLPGAAADGWNGYRFRVLAPKTAESPPATPALLAYPVAYRETGVMTFVLDSDGVVYEKDLGKETAQLAPAIEAPPADETWRSAAR